MNYVDVSLSSDCFWYDFIGLKWYTHYNNLYRYKQGNVRTFHSSRRRSQDCLNYKSLFLFLLRKTIRQEITGPPYEEMDGKFYVDRNGFLRAIT